MNHNHEIKLRSIIYKILLENVDARDDDTLLYTIVAQEEWNRLKPESFYDITAFFMQRVKLRSVVRARAILQKEDRESGRNEIRSSPKVEEIRIKSYEKANEIYSKNKIKEDKPKSVFASFFGL